MSARLFGIALALVSAASAASACKGKGTPRLDDTFKNADPGWGRADNIAAFTAHGLILRPPAQGSAWRWNQGYKMDRADLCIEVGNPAILPMEPDEALKQFYKMYRLGQHGSPAARAVAFHRGPKGGPLDQTMGIEPSALRYFGPAVTGSDLEVDPEHVRRIIAQRMAQGGKKARKAEKEAEEAAWFKKVWGYDPTQS